MKSYKTLQATARRTTAFHRKINGMDVVQGELSLAICKRRCRIMSSDAEITARDCVKARSGAVAGASATAGAVRKTAISEGISNLAVSYRRQA
jgi:hypothetical protein